MYAATPFEFVHVQRRNQFGSWCNKNFWPFVSNAVVLKSGNIDSSVTSSCKHAFVMKRWHGGGTF